ncbi:hypothetical protein GGS24DRAFT_501997 [Hypoxylon argillaceum]|nr:hypothetical protein GGS24DRAFT_501997 [Hypoxylon argillaceum]
MTGDIENEEFAEFECFFGIDIYNVTESLNFTNVSSVGFIQVFDNNYEIVGDGQRVLNFPRLSNFGYFEANDSSALTQILMPNISGSGPGYNFTLNNIPNIEVLDLGNLTNFGHLEIIDSLSALATARFEITGVTSLKTNSATQFPNLTVLQDLVIIASDYPGLLSLDIVDQVASVNNLRLASESSPVEGDPLTVLGAVQLSAVNESLSVQNLYLFQKSILSFAQMTTVGQNVSITSNTNAIIQLDKLQMIGGSLTIANNTSCTFALNQLSSMENLSIIDNESILPFLSALERPENIHLRGYLPTDPGPNIFLSLRSVSGSVIIEAWNDDFNCSKLVSQWQDSVIHFLQCNGTDNSTTDSSPVSMPGSGSLSEASGNLSEGAWAGIGVGIGVIVLGGVVALVWLFLHYRGQRSEVADTTPEKLPEQPEVKAPDLAGLNEMEAQRIVREAPDGTIYEMEVRPTEISDDHRREMYVLPEEMPTPSPVIDQKNMVGNWELESRLIEL